MLVQGSWCVPEQTPKGCKSWTPNGSNVCCDSCHAGNRLFKKCGPKPQDLCTPCRPNMYTKGPTNYECTRCTQCVGVQILLKECTPSSDTVCGCKEGLLCGNDKCSFCIEECGKGQEPTENRSCRPCPNGTFNDQIHQKCKPWSTKCPNPDDIIMSNGDAITDNKCGPDTDKTISPKSADETWPLLLTVLTAFVMMLLAIILVTAMKISMRRKTPTAVSKPPIIRTPTDDPRTLIAIECSFHEAEQEHGSSSESLVSSEASKQLIRWISGRWTVEVFTISCIHKRAFLIKQKLHFYLETLVWRMNPIWFTMSRLASKEKATFRFSSRSTLIKQSRCFRDKVLCDVFLHNHTACNPIEREGCGVDREARGILIGKKQNKKTLSLHKWQQTVSLCACALSCH